MPHMNLFHLFRSRTTELILSILLVVASSGPFSSFRIIIFPGILIFCLRRKNTFSGLEKIFFAGLLSLAFWVVSFPMLKYIPISLTTYSTIIQIVTIITILYRGLTRDFLHLKISGVLLFTGILLASGPFVYFYFHLIGPVGNDMGIVSYTAAVIEIADAYPKSYEPLLPISHFGFAPVGFSALSAMISLFSSLPIHKSLLLLSLLSYPTYLVVLFLYLSNFFSHFKSLIVAYIVLLYGLHIRGYFPWGGNITIWSIIFLITGVWLYIRLLKHNQLSQLGIIIVSLFFAASYYTHQVQLFGFGYFVALYVLVTIFTTKNRTSFIKYLLLAAISTTIFLVPFFSSFTTPSKETIEFVRNYLREAPYYTMTSYFSGLLMSVPEFISTQVGVMIYFLWYAGMVVAVIQGSLSDRWHLVATAVLWILLANTKLWFLPLSIALYPERILALASVIYAYFIGKTLILINSKAVMIAGKQRFVFILLLLPWTPHFIRLQSYEYQSFYDTALQQSAVTKHDMTAFKWISQHTKPTDVIMNNEGDAGIWIPVYTKRTITNNDSSPHIFDELFAAENRLQPNYLYIGDKALHPNAIKHVARNYDKKPAYKLVFSSGNARLYKIIHSTLLKNGNY